MTEEIKFIEIGKCLSVMLNQKGIKQADIVRQSGLSRSYISEVITGKKMPEIHTLQRICKCMNIDISQLFLLNLELMHPNKKEIFKTINNLLSGIY